MIENEPHIVVQDLTMAYGSFVVQQDLTFTINRGDIFIIMGGSGCGKSTLMRHMVGLKEPARGQVFYDGVSFWDTDPVDREQFMRKIGISYQSGALWSSMTLAENISLPLQEFTDLSRSQIREIVELKLALVGLAGFAEYYPSEISGGMQKRVGLARAIALDPEIVFFDEPSAGLDPISSRLLDDLILDGTRQDTHGVAHTRYHATGFPHFREWVGLLQKVQFNKIEFALPSREFRAE